MKKNIRIIISCAAIALLVLLDQWTKALAVSNLKGQPPVKVIKGILHLSYAQNTGAAFGIFKDGRIFFLIVTVIILLLMCWLFIRIPENRRYLPLQILLPLIASGAIGNLIDRLKNGYVVDFISIEAIKFPLFNVADILISWPAVILGLLFLFKYRDEDYRKLFGKDDKDTDN